MTLQAFYPWRQIVRRLARRHGFIDPLAIYARLQRFGEPAEVSEPLELVRAGVIFHARGLVNARAIQHNLDWVWPFWIERQFDPSDVAFLPRAFSLTHVNLTHRNWTAVGLPGRDVMPIVDPRGLLTPFWDGWSLDCWAIDDSARVLLPSRALHATQHQIQSSEELAVETRTTSKGLSIHCDARVVAHDDGDRVRLAAHAALERDGWLIVALRPANPEGVSFIDHVSLADDGLGWTVNHHDRILFDQPVERHHASRYRDADVFVRLFERVEQRAIGCPVGLATAAAMFRVRAGVPRQVHVDVPVRAAPAGTRRGVIRDAHDDAPGSVRRGRSASTPPPPGTLVAMRSTWSEALAPAARLELPDDRHVRLWQAALRTLVLCTPDDMVAGPATYRRYWYRDAAFVVLGLLGAGLHARAEHIVQRFPQRQRRNGYYHSQSGEWDSNGQVLWTTERLYRSLGREPDERLWRSLVAGADWIVGKRLSDQGGAAHAGLMPAGFSAEHLGPNDHYYWDAAWSLAGLEAAAALAERRGDAAHAHRWRVAADALSSAIDRSVAGAERRLGRPGVPAAPARRLDAGAIGSVALSWPLQLWRADDLRMTCTLEFLLARCFHDGAFFQDMIHSGVNAYLTLHVAEALARAGDPRHAALVDRVADLASTTGHWPEAVHPHTGGGCMGDGHHAWAAAEWLLITRNAFLREEGDALVIGGGLLPRWLEDGWPLVFGPAPTRFGTASVRIEHAAQAGWRVVVNGWWHGPPPRLELRLPGSDAVTLDEAGTWCRGSDGSASVEVVARRSERTEPHACTS